MKTESPAQRRRADRIAEARCKRLGIRSDLLDDHDPEKDSTLEVAEREAACRRGMGIFDDLPFRLRSLSREGQWI
jgi:hypothetical protein